MDCVGLQNLSNAGKTGGESGIRNPAVIENKETRLFSILSLLRNRSFRRGLTHELARLADGEVDFLCALNFAHLARCAAVRWR